MSEDNAFRLPLCTHAKLLVLDDERNELLLDTAANHHIAVPVTNDLLKTLHTILKMNFEELGEARDVGG